MRLRWLIFIQERRRLPDIRKGMVIEMIKIVDQSTMKYIVDFCNNEEVSFSPLGMQVGYGSRIESGIQMKELLAKTVKELRKHKVLSAGINISELLSLAGADSIRDIVEGIVLGNYQQRRFIESESEECTFELFGYQEEDKEQVSELFRESLVLMEGVVFTRDMVNLPGNKLRPMDFANEIIRLIKDVPIEYELYTYDQLKKMGMGGLTGVGGSSEYPPCFLVLKYLPLKECQEILGLVGKGVTYDTGGYCLKPANSLKAMKGDMAGGAAVAGAMYALAKNRVDKNVMGFIPMCENRISQGSLLPGDVITSYSKKTIEVVNTDAEGRLILADALTYAVENEHVSKVLDIATLTGSVVSMLGFSVAGVMSDDQEFYDEFSRAYISSGEQYLRLPFYPEHEKMIKSTIADIKNLGDKVCGTITAGLFIRFFAQEKPWLHMDIAGTAWVDKPVYEFQTVGATGAGVTTIYNLCYKKGMV